MTVIIQTHQNLARFFLLNAIGTSLSFWVFTIVRETGEAIARTDVEIIGNVSMQSGNSALPVNESFFKEYFDCGKNNPITNIHRQFTPYLYPFVIEYCILTVSVCYNILANINHCTNERAIEGKLNTLFR